MDYQGTVRGGVVLLDSPASLPDGVVVTVTPVDPPTIPPTIPPTLPAAGLWRDRTDLGDSADASLRLRRGIEVGDR